MLVKVNEWKTLSSRNQMYLKVNVGVNATYEQAEDLLKTMLNEQKEQEK